LISGEEIGITISSACGLFSSLFAKTVSNSDELFLGGGFCSGFGEVESDIGGPKNQITT